MSAEAIDDSFRVEVLPACSRFPGIKGALGLHEFMHQVATYRWGAERLWKLGMIDKPVRVEGGPVVVSSICDPIDDVVDLTGLVQ